MSTKTLPKLKGITAHSIKAKKGLGLARKQKERF
jgi:hypothetical protein